MAMEQCMSWSILVQGIEPTATRLSFVPGAHVENGRQLCPGPYRGCKLVLGVLDGENSLFGTKTNHSFVFGTGNFELPYLAST